MLAGEAPLDELLIGALRRLPARLGQVAPYLADQVTAWMRGLAAAPDPADYFRNPLGFPLLRLPWWLGQTLAPAPDDTFQADLVYSTVNGYYFIRLVDNLMDGHALGERELLPALAFFHTEFQSAYQAYFEADHPFWELFRAVWFGAAEVTARDAGLADIDLDAFQLYAGRKVSAAKIPLAAVCWRAGRPEHLAPWAQFVDTLGRWHQMWNDVFDWSKDLRHGTATYFLSEARRRKRPGEPAAAWVVREGFAWGVAGLHTGLAEAQAQAATLGSPGLAAYLERRGALLRQQQAEVAPGLAALAQLAVVMD